MSGGNTGGRLRSERAYETVATMSTRRAHLADLTRQLRRYLKWQRAQGTAFYVPGDEAAREGLEARKKAQQEAQLAALRGDDDDGPAPARAAPSSAASSSAASSSAASSDTPAPERSAKPGDARERLAAATAKKEKAPAPTSSAGAPTAMPWKKHRAMHEIRAEKKKKAEKVTQSQNGPAAAGAPPQMGPPNQGPPAQNEGPPARPEGASGSSGGSKKPETPAEKMAFLRRYLGDCQRCPLCESRSQIVFGNGDPTADLMFVGEGPGREEDRQGLPFVGRSGQLLDKMIEAMGLGRDQVYVTNVVKCRPPSNRNPAPLEVKECSPFLKKQIEVVEPQVIVTVGKFATNAILGQEDVALGRLRGRWHDVDGIAVMPTYHPAYLLRQEPDKGPKRKAWSDLQKVMKRLGL